MTVEPIAHAFSVCKTRTLLRLDPDIPFCFTAKTDGECSLVCPTPYVPAGVLADIAGLLAEHRISVFAVSTYDTDYILTKETRFDRALALLAQAGWTVA